MLAVVVEYLRTPSKRWRSDVARRPDLLPSSADAEQFLTMASSRPAETWARVEVGLRPHTGAAPSSRRKRMADDDPARSAREHAPHDRRDCPPPASARQCDHLWLLFGMARRSGCWIASRRRIARDLQLVLIEEANPARVADRLRRGGSRKSPTLCVAAWRSFRRSSRPRYWPALNWVDPARRGRGAGESARRRCRGQGTAGRRTGFPMPRNRRWRFLRCAAAAPPAPPAFTGSTRCARCG